MTASGLMRRFSLLPIRDKLILVSLAVCISALLPACVVLAAFELYDFRRTMARDMTVLADIVAMNATAAMVFQDQQEAEKTLASLRAEPHVLAACLYTDGDGCFAAFTRPGAKVVVPERPDPDGARFTLQHLTLQRPVVLNGRRIGTIRLQSDLARMYTWLGLFGGLVVLVLAASCAMAFAIAARLQQPIVGPILALADTARRIARDRDYGLRAGDSGAGEIGELAQAFNSMLEQIQQQDAALQAENAERRGAELRIKEQLEHLRLLDEITRAISERLDLESIFQVVVRTLESSLPLDFSCVGLHDTTAGTLSIARMGVNHAALGAELHDAGVTGVELDNSALGRCLRGALVYEADIAREPHVLSAQLARHGLRSSVFTPLVSSSSVFGVMVAARRGAGAFSSVDCEFLRQVGEHVALAASQARLHGALQMAYDDLRQTQQVAMQEERLRALGQMASGIAHDINNALSPVSLYTESLLEQEPGLSERARSYLEVILRAVEDVAQTVARMREFYRQREPQVELLPVRVNHLVQQVLDLTRARWIDMAQQDGIVIDARMELEQDLPVIRGVESEIRDALTNLVFNAVDAMPRGGTLTLRSRPMERPGAPVPLVVAIEVIDQGVGMDDETRRRCLEPFFTTKGERGTGLGLAMVFGMVQRHGAELEIDSARGAGSTIRLVFPVPAEADEQAAGASAPDAAPPAMRLLLVDDDPVLLNSLRTTLEADGHQVVATGGGAEGIHAFEAAQDSFSAVITDLGMPYVDGRKVAAAVKARSPATPVLLLTGWGQRLLADGDIPAYVDHVLAKPPRLRDLRLALARCRGADSDP